GWPQDARAAAPEVDPCQAPQGLGMMVGAEPRLVHHLWAAATLTQEHPGDLAKMDKGRRKQTALCCCTLSCVLCTLSAHLSCKRPIQRLRRPTPWQIAWKQCRMERARVGNGARLMP